MTRLDKVLEGLDERETVYVIARSDAISNSEALRNCGYSQGWLSKRNVDDLNRRADVLRKDKAIRALMLLDAAVEDAAKVKVAGLKVRDDRVKQAVATEILDRAFGKPTQRTELTGKDGGAIEVDDARESIQRKLAGISTASDEG